MNNQDLIKKYWPVGAVIVVVVIAIIVLTGGDDDGFGDLPSENASFPGVSNQQQLGGSGGSSGVTIPNNATGISSECLALAQSFASIAQLFSGVEVDVDQISAQLAAASSGDLPDAIEKDFEVLDSVLNNPGGYASLSDDERDQVDTALDELSTYADEVCSP